MFSNESNIPTQTDGTSCGVFICAYASYYIFTNSLPNMSQFSQTNVPQFRLYMLEVLSQQSIMHVIEGLEIVNNNDLRQQLNNADDADRINNLNANNFYAIND